MYRTDFITIKEASDLLGVCPKTLRRWEQQGKIISIRTPGGHRRFRMSDILDCHGEPEPEVASVVGYARVSRPEQQDQLDRQVRALETFCRQQGERYEIISDIGSGITHQRRGLIRLVEMICDRRVKCLVLPNSERLGRFCSDLIFGLCNLFRARVIILNQPEESSPEEDLVEDIREIVSICYNRLYGLGNPKHQQILHYLQALKDIEVA
ncbi:IS607 family transposase [Pannus brasiliensis CCIBt3594]|uniref:IS607 family transposase n=1 Tax=Pannus brasiliensis CCIBt3594 TaxID=1427578 RepID=A0AAW9QQS0_9CHRO